MTDVPAGRTGHAPTVQITIRLDAREPPEGTVISPTGTPRRFEGWLGLLQVLSEAIGSSADGRQAAPSERPIPPAMKGAVT